MAVSPADPDVIWVNDHCWNTGVIYRTENGGKHWKPVATKQNVGPADNDAAHKALRTTARIETATPAGLSLAGLAADPRDPLVVHGFNTEFLLRTRDGGATWTDITALRPDPKKPDHWRGRGWTGWCSTNIGFNPYRDGQAVVQAMDAGRVWISDDGFKTFRYPAREPNPWGDGNDITFTKDGAIFATTGQSGQFNGILRSGDGGATFETLSGEKRGLPEAGWEEGPEGAGIYAHPEDSKRVWAALGGRLRQSTDSGETWSPFEDTPAWFTWIAGDPTKAGRFYVSAAHGVYAIDNGAAPVCIGGPAPAGGGRINVDAKGRVLACQWRSGRAGL